MSKPDVIIVEAFVMLFSDISVKFLPWLLISPLFSISFPEISNISLPDNILSELRILFLAIKFISLSAINFVFAFIS